MRFIRNIFFLVLIFSGLNSFSQKNNDDKLALQYLDNKEFEKANVYLEKLYDRSPEQWFSYYYTGLVGAKEYSRAEKICKKQLKRSPQATNIYVLIAKLYKAQGDTKKENETYQKAIKEVVPLQGFLQPLAVAMMEETQYDYAIEVYKKGRKATPEYPYYYEIAEVYKRKGDIKAMINEYLDAIVFKES